MSFLSLTLSERSELDGLSEGLGSEAPPIERVHSCIPFEGMHGPLLASELFELCDDDGWIQAVREVWIDKRQAHGPCLIDQKGSRHRQFP